MADMNRRNVLVGLGTAAAGSGIVFGSGAFTQLNADRELTVAVADSDAEGTFSIDVTDDSDSIVADEPGDDSDVAFEIDIEDDVGALNPGSFLDTGLEVSFDVNDDDESFDASASTVTLDEFTGDLGASGPDTTEGLVNFVEDNQTDIGNDDLGESTLGDVLIASDGQGVDLDKFTNDPTSEDAKATDLFISIPEDTSGLDDIDGVRFEVQFDEVE